MTLKTILFGAASALVLSASAANAVPATAETSLNVRSGPGTEYEVVGTIPAGGTVDVRGCTGSWCRVSFAGGTGYASRSYLAIASGGPAVAVAPGYAYYGGPYYDDYYDYGYTYGPTVGFSIGSGGRFHRGWRGGRWDRGHAWNGGGRNWSRNGGGRNWSGRPGQNNPGSVASRQGGFAGPPASFQRPGTGIGGGARMGGRGMSGASAGMRGGASAGGGGGGAPAGGGAAAGGGASAGGGAGGGFAGSIVKH